MNQADGKQPLMVAISDIMPQLFIL